MINNYNQILPNLEQDIINKIHKLEKRRLALKQVAYEIVSIISFISIVPATIYILETFSSSGVFSYISLIFTNIESLSYWKELSMSILESIPFLSLAIGFGALGIFLWSLLKTLKIHEIKVGLV